MDEMHAHVVDCNTPYKKELGVPESITPELRKEMTELFAQQLRKHNVQISDIL